MHKKGDQLGSVDRLTQFTMRHVSRRGLFKGLGAIGLALIGFSAGVKTAMAHIVCPGSCSGACDNCFSWCSSGGVTCECECPSCNCNPSVVSAVQIWIPNFGQNGCLRTCACEAC